MTPKLIFSDIDGTLLNAQREPSPRLIEEVSRLRERGIPFHLISSRMPRAMRWIEDMLGSSGVPLVAYNGGQVIVRGETVLSEEIPLEAVDAARALTRGTGLSLQLFNGDEWYVEALDHYARREENNTRVTPEVRAAGVTVADWRERGLGAHKIMVMGQQERLDGFVETFGARYGERLHLYRSKDDYLEIANKRISKLTGIETVLAACYLDCGPVDCLAFGDNYNDIDMLRGVGMGIAVASARREVIAAADGTTEAAKEDGVARALARIFAP